jgi:hypothetical protein
VVEPLVREGPALLGFVAARIAGVPASAFLPEPGRLLIQPQGAN